MTQVLIPLVLVILLSLPAIVLAAPNVPPLMLANLAPTELNYADYWVSEKFDGVRGYWNGSAMLTRSGNVIPLPPWLQAQFDQQVVEGELWLGHGRFDEVSALVRRQNPNEALWQSVKFKAFDLPLHTGNFTERMASLANWANQPDRAAIEPVTHRQLESAEQARAIMEKVVQQGGEGLMLNKTDAVYEPKRSQALYKLKPRWDDEATVVGYSAGKGKYEGQVGALIVQWQQGMTFKVGSGLTDADRANPPEIGSTITFEYSGLTRHGVPRFARYLRKFAPL